MLTTVRRSAPLAGLCAVILTGCNIGWTRPNTTQAEFNQDRYACQQEAARIYPTAMMQQTVGTGYQNPAQTECYGYGNNNISCTTTGGNYVPPRTITVDANANNRSTAFDSCMNARSYTFKMEMASPSTLPGTALPGTGARCNTHSDCDSGLVCRNNTCVDLSRMR